MLVNVVFVLLTCIIECLVQMLLCNKKRMKINTIQYNTIQKISHEVLLSYEDEMVSVHVTNCSRTDKVEDFHLLGTSK
jgi:hypothetical protein